MDSPPTDPMVQDACCARSSRCSTPAAWTARPARPLSDTASVAAIAPVLDIRYPS